MADNMPWEDDYSSPAQPSGSGSNATTSTQANNTGNIRSSNGGFKKYDSPDAGVLDQQRLLQTYQDKHGLNTVRGIVSRWAPPNENDTNNYINYMSHQLGVSPDAQIDLSDPEMMGKFSYAQALIEKGAKNVHMSRDQYIDLARTRRSGTAEQANPWEDNYTATEAPVSPSEATQEPLPWEDTYDTPKGAPSASGEASEGTVGNWSGNAGYVQPTARGLTGAAVSVANIPAEIADSFTSAGAWLGGKLGIGNGTYTPAPRVTTADIENGLHVEPGSLTPQTTAEKVFAGAVPFLMGTGEAEAATAGATKAGRVVNSIVRNMKESAFGSLAQSSEGNPDDLATNLALNTVGGVAMHGISTVGKSVVNSAVKPFENLSNAVNTSKALENEYYSTMDKYNRADMKYRIALNKKIPDEELKPLRDDYLQAEEEHEAAKSTYENFMNESGLAGNEGGNKADYLYDRVQFMRDLNKKGANLGVEDVYNHLQDPVTGEHSPLLMKYKIPIDKMSTIGKSISKSPFGKVSEILGITPDFVGKNANAAESALKNMGNNIVDKISNPDAVGWRSLVPVIEDLRAKKFESANVKINDLRSEMTPEAAYEKYNLNPMEYAEYHKALDDLSTMRKFISNAPNHKASKAVYNVTGRILSHLGLLHVSGPVGMIATPITRVAIGKVNQRAANAGLNDLQNALAGKYTKSQITQFQEMFNDVAPQLGYKYIQANHNKNKQY